MSTERDNWMTPRWFCDMVHEVMGGIDLDPMSSPAANDNVRANEFWWSGALERPWRTKSLYLNPPYSVELCRPSIEHFIAELPTIEEAIVLTNAVHDTRAGALLLQQCDAVCLPARRIQFDAPPGVKSSSNRFNQMVTYFGDHHRAFARVFEPLGSVFR